MRPKVWKGLNNCKTKKVCASFEALGKLQYPHSLFRCSSGAVHDAEHLMVRRNGSRILCFDYLDAIFAIFTGFSSFSDVPQTALARMARELGRNIYASEGPSYATHSRKPCTTAGGH
jgi:hypothetical protein